MTDLVYLLETQPYDPSSASLKNVFFSQGLIDESALGTANPYPVRLRQAFSHEIAIFEQNIPGETTISIGSAVINNADGRFDYLLNYNWDGRLVIVRRGLAGDPYANFVVEFVGSALELTADQSNLVLTLRDNSFKLAKPLQPNKYLGSGGPEGGLDLKAKPKPLLFGYARNISPVGVDAVLLTAQANDGPLFSVDAVFDRANPLEFHQDYGSYAALVAGSIPPGRYGTCLAEGFIRLGAPPAGAVTMDATGFYDTAENLPDLVRMVLLGKVALSAGDIDGTSFDEAAVDAPLDFEGIYYSEPDFQVDEFVETMAATMNGFWYVNRLGFITFRQFRFRTPSVIVRQEDITALGKAPSPSPLYRILVNYAKNNTIQQSNDFTIPRQTLNGYLSKYIHRVPTFGTPDYTGAGQFKVYLNDTQVNDIDQVQFRIPNGETWIDIDGAGNITVVDPGVNEASAVIRANIGEFFLDEVFTLIKDTSSPLNALVITPSSNRFYFDDFGNPAPSNQVITVDVVGTNATNPITLTAVDNLGQGVSFSGNTIPIGNVSKSPLVFSIQVTATDANGLTQTTKLMVQRGNDAYAQGILGGMAATGSSFSIHFQEEPPTENLHTDDLWIDTNDGNKQYRWDGDAWVAVSDTRIAAALLAASDANTAVAGKIKTFFTTTATPAPTATAVGDLWYVESTKTLYRWNGTTWANPIATVGATTGTTLFLPNGTILTGNDIVTSLGIAADFSGRGVLATLNNIDLAGALILNKSLSNLDPTAGGKLDTIQTGAGVGDSIFPNSNLSDGATNWTLTGYTLLNGSGSDPFRYFRASLTSLGMSAVAKPRLDLNSGIYKAVTPGSKLYLSYRARAANGIWSRFYLQSYKADGTLGSLETAAYMSTGTGGAWQWIDAVVDIPTDVTYIANVSIFASAQTVTGNFDLSEIRASYVARGATVGATTGSNLYGTGGTVLTQGDIKTIEGIAADFANRGALATLNALALGSSLLTGFGSLAARNLARLGFEIYRADGLTLATDAMLVTSLGVASDFSGRGALATLNFVTYGTSNVNGFGVLASRNVISGTNLHINGSFEAGFPSITARSDGGAIVVSFETGVGYNGNNFFRMYGQGGHTDGFSQTFVATQTSVVVSASFRDGGTAVGWSSGQPNNPQRVEIGLRNATDAVWWVGTGGAQNGAIISLVNGQGWTRYTRVITGLTIGKSYAICWSVDGTSGSRTVDMDALQAEFGDVGTDYSLSPQESNNYLIDPVADTGGTGGRLRLFLRNNGTIFSTAYQLNVFNGADVTGSNVAADFSGRGALATLNSLAYGSGFLSGFGSLAARSLARLGFEIVRQDGSTSVTDATAITSLGVASDFSGRGALATLNSLAYGGSQLTGFGTLAARTTVRFGTEVYRADGSTVTTDAMVVTSIGVASDFSGRGALATLNSLAYGSGQLTGFGTLAARTTVRIGTEVYRADGTTVTTDVMVVTTLGVSADFSGRGALATLNSLDLAGALITNKSLLNLDPTANTKLGGISPNATTDIRLTTFGNATLTGNTIKSNTSGDGTDGAGSADKVAGACMSGFVVGQLGNYMTLVTTGGTQGFSCNLGGDGNIRTYRGVGQTDYGVIGSAVVGDSLVLIQDETKAQIWKNGVVYYTFLYAPQRQQSWYATFSTIGFGIITGVFFRAYSDNNFASQGGATRPTDYAGLIPPRNRTSELGGVFWAETFEEDARQPTPRPVGWKGISLGLGRNDDANINWSDSDDDVYHVGEYLQFGRYANTTWIFSPAFRVKGETKYRLKFKVFPTRATLSGIFHAQVTYSNNELTGYQSSVVDSYPITNANGGVLPPDMILETSNSNVDSTTNGALSQVSYDAATIGGRITNASLPAGTSWGVIEWTAPTNAKWASLEFARTGAGGRINVTEVIVEGVPTLESDLAKPTMFRNLGWLNGRAIDGRLLNSSNNFGLRSLADAGSITYTDTGSGVTINIPGTTLYTDWGATISLPSGSVPGAAYNSIYFIYRNQIDPSTTGVSYGASTNLADALGVGKVYLFYISTPAAAGLPPPPPPPPPPPGNPREDYCVYEEAWVDTGRGYIPARCVVVGDSVRILNVTRDETTWTPCIGNKIAEADCVTLETESGIELTLSKTTPITLQDGSIIYPDTVLGVDVPVHDCDEFRWEKCVKVTEAGVLKVAHISVSQNVYAAGNLAGRSILTHNPIAKP